MLNFILIIKYYLYSILNPLFILVLTKFNSFEIILFHYYYSWLVIKALQYVSTILKVFIKSLLKIS